MNRRTISVFALCAVILLGAVALLFEFGTEIAKKKCQERNLKNGCNGRRSGINRIEICTLDPFLALCNGAVENGGWMVIHKRFDGSENFNRSWTDYQKGFGKISGEFFIGLDLLHRITNSQQHELYIQMTDNYGNEKFVRFDNFRIANGDKNYKLESLGESTGTQEESMSYISLNQAFSTYDHDNDQLANENCALNGAWWHNYCAGANLNGKYYIETAYKDDSMSWNGFTPLKSIQMLIRAKCVKLNIF